MSTIIIITPPRPQFSTDAEALQAKQDWDAQLKKDCAALEAAGFRVQYYKTE